MMAIAHYCTQKWVKQVNKMTVVWLAVTGQELEVRAQGLDQAYHVSVNIDGCIQTVDSLYKKEEEREE